MTSRPIVLQIALDGKLSQIFGTLNLPSFSDGANCTEQDPELFFSEDFKDIRQAKAVCNGCPLISQCKDWAMSHENYGVWGGMSAKERFLARGGVEALETQEIVLARQQFFEILSLPLSSLSQRFGVTERTIVRWKNTLRDAA